MALVGSEVRESNTFSSKLTIGGSWELSGVEEEPSTPVVVVVVVVASAAVPVLLRLLPLRLFMRRLLQLPVASTTFSTGFGPQNEVSSNMRCGDGDLETPDTGDSRLTADP